MKTTYILFAALLYVNFAKGQDIWSVDFEDTTFLNRVFIDTNSNPNNVWKIGKPDKTIFDSAYSFPNVIVTDTINPYPVNDTSSFIISHIVSGGLAAPWGVAFLDGYYNVNSDSINDYGKIEFSPDNGTTWLDLINDTIYNSYFNWGTPPDVPTFTGNSNGWKHFHVDVEGLGSVFNLMIGDTILYRFTFISDSVQTGKDGLMFDNFFLQDYFEGIPEIQNNNLISISPNPASGKLIIHRKEVTDRQTLQIFDLTGETIYENGDFKEESFDAGVLKNGIYILKYSDGVNYSVTKLIILH